MPRLLPIGLVTFALLLGACSDDSDDEPDESDPESTATTDAAGSTADAIAAAAVTTLDDLPEGWEVAPDSPDILAALVADAAADVEACDELVAAGVLTPDAALARSGFVSDEDDQLTSTVYVFATEEEASDFLELTGSDDLGPCLADVLADLTPGTEPVPAELEPVDLGDAATAVGVTISDEASLEYQIVQTGRGVVALSLTSAEPPDLTEAHDTAVTRLEEALDTEG